jgi:hypothetical protein
VVLTGSSVEVPVHAEADRLHFLGNVTVPDGYPTRGEVGGQMGSYTIYYADGSKQEVRCGGVWRSHARMCCLPRLS